MVEKRVQLEAYYVSTLDRTGWPSGKFRTEMSKGIPFIKTHPKEIIYFDNVAKHNDWLNKFTPNEINALKRKSEKKTNDRNDEIIMKNRQFADEAIEELKSENKLLENKLGDNAQKLDISQSVIGELEEKVEASNKRFIDLEKELMKLKKALGKKNAKKKSTAKKNVGM